MPRSQVSGPVHLDLKVDPHGTLIWEKARLRVEHIGGGWCRGWGGFGQAACDAQQSSQLMQWSWAVTAQHEGHGCQNSAWTPFCLGGSRLGTRTPSLNMAYTASSYCVETDSCFFGYKGSSCSVFWPCCRKRMCLLTLEPHLEW